MMNKRALAALSIVGLVLLLTACPQTVSRPKPFSFTAVTNADPGADVLSNEVTITGLTAPAIATVSAGGTLIINGKVTTSPASVTDGSGLRVRVKASTTFGGKVSVMVDVGGEKASFQVTTRAANTSVEGFDFQTAVPAEPGARVLSNVVVVAGIETAVQVEVEGEGAPELIVNGAPSGSSVEVEAGDELQVAATASSTFGDSVTASVSVGEEQKGSFTVPTRDLVPAVVDLSTVPGGVTSVAPGATISLAWSVTGDYDQLTLTTEPGSSSQDVMGQSGLDMVAPSDLPSVTYVLTASHSQGAPMSDAVTVSVPLWVCTDPAAVITFDDQALEVRVRAMPGIPTGTDPITCEDARDLDVLDARQWDASPYDSFSSLVGIQHFVNLETFWAEYNEVDDITPLSGLTSLVDLNLDRNRFNDITPLANMTDMQHLSLWDVGPTRYSEVQDDLGMTTQEKVQAGCYDGIGDLAPLAQMTNLETLFVSCNNIADISALGGMSDLTSVYALTNKIPSLSPLSGKTQLQVLRVSDNQLTGTDASVLASLSNLVWLEIGYDGLLDASLEGLRNLGNLYTVNIEGNYFSDLSPLTAGSSPGLTDSGDSEELASLPGRDPALPAVSLAYNCIADVPATQTALEGQGWQVIGSAGPQRSVGSCTLGPAGIDAAADLQRLERYRQTMHTR